MLTIDPAKRLANALGLEGLGNVERRVPDEVLARRRARARVASCRRRCSTRRRSWDDLVLRHAPDEETAYRILENRLYHNLTGRFVQSHDYIAMERLYDLHASGQYDLIVIDTPPTRNAIDFLEAPTRMADFFGGRLLRWLTMPYRVGGKRGARLVNFASRALLPDGRPHPRQPVPPGHRRVLPELPDDVRRVRRAGRSRRAAAARPPHRRSWSSRPSRARRCARPSSSATRSTARELPPRRARAEQDPARTSCERDGRRAADALLRRRTGRSRRGARRGLEVPALDDARRRRPGAAHGAARRSANYSVVATPRGASCETSSRRVPETVVDRPGARGRRPRRRRARAHRGAPLRPELTPTGSHRPVVIPLVELALGEHALSR